MSDSSNMSSSDDEDVNLQSISEDPNISFDSEFSSDVEIDNVNDDDYFPTVEGKRKAEQEHREQERARKRMKKVSYATRTAANTASNESKRDQEHYLEVMKDFEPTELFSILASSDDISIEELLRELLEGYNEDRDTVIQKIINLLLDCCGVTVHVQNHDVHSNDSATDTVSEVQLSFQSQRLHEFTLLISKSRKKKTRYLHLYENFVEFMLKFLEIANELQLLFSEGDDEQEIEEKESSKEIKMSPLVVDLLTWLASFSVSKIRCFRYVSTLSLYIFQDYLSGFAVSLEKDYLAKLTKQLKMETGKKRPNKKIIEKLTENVEEIQGNKTVVDNIMDNINKLCFVHRFKDVDEGIRGESMAHLSVWVETNPEYFMKVTYLKYFGWLLSDTSSNVRFQILKSLPNIIKASHHSSMVDNPAIRQFFERFKSRLLEVATSDIDTDVNIAAINVLTEAISLDYLEDDEIISIASSIFVDEDVKVSSYSKNARLMASIARFIARAATERYSSFMSSSELAEDISKVKTSSIIKIGTINRLLEKALHVFLDSRSEQTSVISNEMQILYQAAEFLYPYFGSEISSICELLTDDNEFNDAYEQITSVYANDNDVNYDMDQDSTDSPQNTNNSPLLPDSEQHISFYLTVLSGLCNGGMNGRSQSKLSLAEAILPHLANLLKNLSTNSSEVLLQILTIFNLFDFEFWVNTGHKKDIGKINQMILRGFKGIVLTSTSKDDRLYTVFSNTIQHIKKFKLKEVDEKWVKEISMIKLQLLKYLSEFKEDTTQTNFLEFQNTVFSQYLNRLVVLGKEYPVEFSIELVDLLRKRYLSRIAIEVEIGTVIESGDINFKLPVILITWELHKWLGIISNSRGLHDQSSSKNTDRGAAITTTKTVNGAMNYISEIIDGMEKTLVELNNVTNSSDYVVHDLCSSLANSIIDSVVSLESFELQIPDDEINWKDIVGETITERYMTKNIYQSLLDVFLYRESLFAASQQLQLEREGDEDVTLNGLYSNADTYQTEKGLFLYTIKLMGLRKLGLLDEKTFNRICLNKEILGSTFESIIDDSVFETKKNGQSKIRNLRINVPETSLPNDVGTPNITENRSSFEPTREQITKDVDGQPAILDDIPENSTEIAGEDIRSDKSLESSPLPTSGTNGLTSEI